MPSELKTWWLFTFKSWFCFLARVLLGLFHSYNKSHKDLTKRSIKTFVNSLLFIPHLYICQRPGKSPIRLLSSQTFFSQRGIGQNPPIGSGTTWGSHPNPLLSSVDFSIPFYWWILTKLPSLAYQYHIATKWEWFALTVNQWTAWFPQGLCSSLFN